MTTERSERERNTGRWNDYPLENIRRQENLKKVRAAFPEDIRKVEGNSPVHAPHYATGMPLGEQIARQVSATDQTSRVIHYQRLEAEAKKFFRPAKLPRPSR